MCACIPTLFAPGEDPQLLLKPGKNKDGYFNNEMMVAQTHIALDSFDATYPNAVGVFLFDCSSGHEALPADALCANKLRAGD